MTAIVTEEGVARAPFADALAGQVSAADARRAAAPGFAALLAERAAATSPAPDAPADDAAPGSSTDDPSPAGAEVPS